MPAAFALTHHNARAPQFAAAEVEVIGTLNFGSSAAALADADLLALVNATLPDHQKLTAIKSVSGGPCKNGDFAFAYDRAAAESKLVGIRNEFVESGALAVTSHESVALTGDVEGVHGAEITAGSATGVCKIGLTTTPAATLLCYYNPTTKKVKFYATDAATECKVLYSRRLAFSGDLSHANYTTAIRVLGTR